MQSRDQFLLLPVIQNPMLGPVGNSWRGDDICAWTALKTDKSSHQHACSIKRTVLVSIWIFKDLNRAREKGIQSERKMQCKHCSDPEGWCNQRRLRLYQIKSEFTGWRDGIGSNKIVVRRGFYFSFSLPPFSR